MPSSSVWLLRLLIWLVVIFAVLVLSLLVWGSDLLIAVEPMPAHVDAAVVLQGSIVAEMSRLAGAMSLLQQGTADRALISVPKQSYWGQSIPPIARAYMEKKYGGDLAARVDFCVTDIDVNSTSQEAQVALSCVQEHHWRSIAIVTSDYHTRRACMLWRRAIKRSRSSITLSTDGVLDPEFQKPWWRHRQAAKIWVAESVKLIWALFGG